MTVFKTFLQVVKANKVVIIMYTVFLIFFGTINMQTSDNNVSFIASKPRVLIINKDDSKFSKSLVKYIENNTEKVDIKTEEEAINDALFYRDLSYVIYINEGYGKKFLNDEEDLIEIKSNNVSGSVIAERLVNRYISTSKSYKKVLDDEESIIKNTEETLNNKVVTEISSKLDTTKLSNATFFYNFMNYSLLAGCVYVICLVISSFRDEKIRKRTEISSIDYKKYNRLLILSNALFALILWTVYIILSFILIGDIMFSMHGLIYILNSFVFCICALTISFLIGNITCNKNAINGLINVVALGSSFLCGAFVPMEILPDSVLKVAHVLPSYWYVKTNELLKTTESITFETLKPLLGNMLVVIMFTVMFIIITNIITGYKRKIKI